MRPIACCLVLLGLATGASAQGERCRVADPSGTPLNVRTMPLGKVIDTLPNGLGVRVFDEQPA